MTYYLIINSELFNSTSDTVSIASSRGAKRKETEEQRERQKPQKQLCEQRRLPMDRESVFLNEYEANKKANENAEYRENRLKKKRVAERGR